MNGLRFIIGTGCNYDCFYCHHEGCFLSNDILDLSVYEHKIKLLYDFCIKYKIYEIAITGGEPFLYLERLKVLFKYFSKYPFHIVVNSNASLIINNINYVKQLENKIEFHINFSSLNKKTHEKIINKKLFEEEFNSLNLLKETKHIIKLNIICLKSINENELIDINKFAIRNGFFQDI
ncbi:MAG: radical SAM protein [Clostridia bacterium]|nr:radical SAM protein [Clostridia bacterium]